jgi:transcription antitermination factor NusG|tara:strand:+ start:131 stop:640 length:510 start_codon:yes stop_codon:yes gene_type:complete
MKKTILLITGLYLFSCAAGIPSWYSKLPDKKGFRYAVGTEVGNELQNAVDEAREIAVRTLAQQMETEISGYIKRAQEEINDITAIDNFQSMQEDVFSVKIGDYRVAKQEIVKEKKKFRVYILIEYDEVAAQKRLLSRIKADKELYEAIRSTELYDDMEKKVADYRARNR